MSNVTQEIRASASYIYHGDAICQEKSKLLLTEMGLPGGLINLEDIEEFGYVKDTGFVWLIQKKPNKTKNKMLGTTSSKAREVTGFIEKFKIKKLTGVKGKDFLIWIEVSEISVDNPPTGKVTFKSKAGITKSYPLEAFQIDDTKKKDMGGVGVDAKHVKVK